MNTHAPEPNVIVRLRFNDLKTDPIKWDSFMREIGKESFYIDVELPRLMKRGVIDSVIIDY